MTQDKSNPGSRLSDPFQPRNYREALEFIRDWTYDELGEEVATLALRNNPNPKESER